MHYEVEVRVNTGDWVAKRERHKLLMDARLKADQVRDRGGEPRMVKVDKDGGDRWWGRVAPKRTPSWVTLTHAKVSYLFTTMHKDFPALYDKEFLLSLRL